MTINKRKKNTRQRGKTTHGWGARKKHRGSGNRGGKGNAGSSKRGDAKKPSFWKTRRFGKHGFKIPGKRQSKAINIASLEVRLNALQEEGAITQKDGTFVIDLGKLGYDKLLGTGIPKSRMMITVSSASVSAAEKVKSAGGSVTLTRVGSEEQTGQ